MGDIWLWFVFAGVPFDVRGGSSFFFFFLLAVLSLGRPPSQHTWFSHPRMRSGGYDMYDAWGRNILGCHTSFSRGPWSRYFCLWFGVSLFDSFPSLFFFFDAYMSPSSYGTHFARWLGARFVLFFVVVACWFLVFASFLLLCLWSAHKSLAPSEAVWGASPIPAAQPVALFARPDQEFSCRCYGILISVGFL